MTLAEMAECATNIIVTKTGAARLLADDGAATATPMGVYGGATVFLEVSCKEDLGLTMIRFRIAPAEETDSAVDYGQWTAEQYSHQSFMQSDRMYDMLIPCSMVLKDRDSLTSSIERYLSSKIKSWTRSYVHNFRPDTDLVKRLSQQANRNSIHGFSRWYSH